MPVFLLAAFAKNAKVSLSESERQALMKVAKGIVAQSRIWRVGAVVGWVAGL